MWDALSLDVRHSIRSLRRAPTFSLIVIVTLTVAVGATTAVGSLLNTLVFRKLALPSPEQLVALSATDARGNATGYFYADTFAAYRSAQRSFAQLSMYSGGGLVHVEAPSEAFDASTERVSPNYFDMLGARLSVGRSFADSDDAVIVISEKFRRRVFGNASGVGETIKVDARPVTVIGVAANGSNGLAADYPADLFVPFAPVRTAPGDPPRPARSWNLVGRLARGVSIGVASAELIGLWPSIQAATLPTTLPESEREALLRQRVDVEPLATGFSGLRDRYGTTVRMVLALMGLLLAVACANLAGLALARSLMRRHQVAIRLALGGTAPRVFWQLLLDGLLLSAVAFAGAVPLASRMVQLLRATLLADTIGSRAFPPATPDAGVLAAAALLTLLVGVTIGVVSAWRSVTVGVDEGLRRGRRIVGSLGRFGRGLLVAQVAMSMTCLVAAGLFMSTLARLRANDSSLQSQRIVFTRAYREPDDHAVLTPEYYRALVSDLARMPGAEAAALSVYYPTYYGRPEPIPTERYTRADGDASSEVAAWPEFASPGFFDLFRLPRLQGRDITWNDGPGKPDVALLSASLARALFPAGDAVGHHLRLVGPQPRDLDVIGVVADAPYIKLDDPRPFVVFRPILQDLARSQFPMAYVRASGDLAIVRDGYARVVKTLGHRWLRGFITSSEWVNHALLRERFTAGLAAFAAALTSVLACMGVYGLLAYSVTARVREIGVRLALGASRGSVIWMIVGDGLAIAVPGVLLGGLCAWAAARLARAQLYGIAPGDPRMLAIAAALSLATVLAASLLPALRASRVAPVGALRED